MSMRTSRRRAAHAVLSLATAWGLAACGGGDGDTGPGPAGPDTTGAATAPLAAAQADPPPVAGPVAAPVRTERVTGGPHAMTPNTRYEVDAGEPVTLTLPEGIERADVIQVVGLGSGRWRIALAEGQRLRTPEATGALWAEIGPTPGQDAKWWSAQASADGTVLVAAANEGLLHVSRDGGRSWSTPLDGPRNWSAVAVSETGRKIAATVYGGGIWVSRDYGQTWDERRPASNPQGREWVSVAMSAHGGHIAAAERNGYIEVSEDAGLGWTRRGGPPRAWQSVAMAANGQNLAAVASDGSVWTSDDIGYSWQPRIQGDYHWYRVATSADGATVAAADAGGQVWVSRDWGITWTPRFRHGPVNAIAVSADGQRIAVAVPWASGLPDGRVHVSHDGGETWTPQLHDADWRGLAMTADGGLLLAADNPGRLWTSRGGPTRTEGPAGSLSGGPGDAITLLHLGDGVYELRAATGAGLRLE